MSRAYSRADVRQHSDNGYNPHPAVNIKADLYTFSDDLLRTAYADTVGGSEADAAGFLAWWRAKEDEDGPGGLYGAYGWLDTAGQWAAESGFEDAENDAIDIFPQSVKIYGEGRSGGWLVVHGLPDVDEWDAIALARWRRFERYVWAIRDYHPTMVAGLIALNGYEREREESAAREAEVRKWAELARLLPAVAS